MRSYGNFGEDVIVGSPRSRLIIRCAVGMLDTYGVANLGFTLTTVKADGDDVVATPPIIDPERQTSYWTTRRNFLEMMYRAVEERNDGSIRLLYGHSFQSIGQGPGGVPQVTISDSDLAASQLTERAILPHNGG